MNFHFSKAVLPLGLVVCGVAFAQTPPNAGSLNQQIEREQAPLAPAKPIPEIRIEQDAAPTAAVSDHQKILVRSLQVTGAHVYAEAALLDVTGFSASRELTLSELRGMASKIARYYHVRGYLLAQAYLPAQDIKDGVVTIAVLEGHYGKVTVRNSTNLSDDLANGLLSGLNSSDAVSIAPLETSLLLLSDLPGVNVRSTLVPGASVGASDLIVDVTPGQRVTGAVDVDNGGNRYTGAHRVGATVNINNPTGLGDVATLRALTSGSGLNYARASYQVQIDRAKAGVAYASMRYRLGEEFESLQANGTAQIASVYGSVPLIRSRSNNLYAVINFDAKTFQDKVDSTATRADKKARVAMASLTGDHRDGFGGGGLSTYAFTWTTGQIDIKSAASLAADAATVQSNGHYDKLGFNAMRLQRVTDTLSLYAAANGQLASKNLDTSEKMGLGGANGVRAYPEGEAYADQGYVLNLEVRALLPRLSERQSGQMQLIGFVDTGTATLNKNPWVAGQNRRTLSGAGVGFNWVDNDNFVVKAYYARKLGNATAMSAPDKTGRFWLQAAKYF
ncbi:ShlB/FhaC/HecB family hemolysin secretion/activation protein [Herminiimonas sp. NPDC097707]|uniref:ShlB/FhaC/HecB family hemolysin secretion/activation protein n=1 Tax=Herminiimonas sp. NPDC097707 TaxID=3364007 RepID=UPI00383B6F1C